ncbi:MAG: hypothetical protein NVV74_13185 [Magnetospirillum sp.]|nr:hypothetical protein [Magnetospirillum sp.]
MGAPKSTKAVHTRVSTALERLEQLMGNAPAPEPEHVTPETVEESVRRLKGNLPAGPHKPQGD